MRPVRPTGLNVTIHPALHGLGRHPVIRLPLPSFHLTLGTQSPKFHKFSQHLPMGNVISHASDSKQEGSRHEYSR